jgi:O-antigen/teichoic acid export membrane protein
MEKSYKGNYIKNVVTQAVATILGLLSLFVIVPFLSNNQILYGIYSVCISLTIFFNYADLGFLTAGQKYAAEFYAKNEFDKEKRIIGFTACALILFCILVAILLTPVAVNPKLIINDIGENVSVARSLIIILILASPFTIIKRVCSSVFTIRIEQYKYNAIVLLSQLVKILSVLYFFRENKYELVEYYLFVQLTDVATTVILFLIVVYYYKYEWNFVSLIKFDRDIWRLVKDLAFVSFFMTITWILYYELDLVAIARLAKPGVVALYSTAFTLLTFSRNYLSIIYSSFSARYNHFVGVKDYEGLRAFYLSNIYILFPIVFIPLFAFVLFANPFVCTWAGTQYQVSGFYTQILIAGNLLAFVSYPSGQYLLSVNKTKDMYKVSVLLPLIFWGGVFVTYGTIGILSFALFKSLAQIVSAICYFLTANKHMNIKTIIILKRTVIYYTCPILIMGCVYFLIFRYCSFSKGVVGIVVNLGCILVVAITGVVAGLSTSQPFRKYALTLLRK